MREQHWQDWLIAVVGVWLVISNWFLAYAIPEAAPATTGSVIYWNAIGSGVLAIVLGIAALASFRIWEEWADIVLGLWLVASPWALGFASVSTAVWNVALCGAVIILSAVWALYDTREAGHA